MKHLSRMKHAIKPLENYEIFHIRIYYSTPLPTLTFTKTFVVTTIIEYLKQWSQKHDWDKYITYATKAYNTNVHEGRKYTPHELMFGRMARIFTSSTLADDKSNESYFEYATALQPNLQRSSISKNLAKMSNM